MLARIWVDNQSTICLAKTGRSSSERSMHIDISFFQIHDIFISAQGNLEHIHMGQMIADMLKKSVQGYFQIFLPK